MSDRVIQRFETSANTAAQILNGIGMAILLALMFLGSAEVIGRYAFNRPIAGSMEVSLVLLAAMVYVSWAYTQFVNAHVQVDIVTSRFSRRLQAMIRLVVSLLVLGLFGLIAWCIAEVGMTFWKANRLIDIVDIPLAPVLFLGSLGALAFCLVLISQILQSIRDVKEGD